MTYRLGLGTVTLPSTAAVLALATAAWMTGAARADSGNNDAAQLCLDGPQWDYYQIVSGDPKDIDFGGLVHGFDEEAASYYVQAGDHDQCVAFAAANKRNGNSTTHLSDLAVVKYTDASSPRLFN